MTDARVFPNSKIGEITTILHNNGKTIVLVGGCFDVVHVGHVKFFEQAKRHGDILIVLLESDEKVRELKGKNRPLFIVSERAKLLSSLVFVDYVVILPFTKSDTDYEKIISQIHPSVIAVTEHDPNLAKKRDHASRVGAKLVTIAHINTHSTSSLAQKLGIN